MPRASWTCLKRPYENEQYPAACGNGRSLKKSPAWAGCRVAGDGAKKAWVLCKNGDGGECYGAFARRRVGDLLLWQVFCTYAQGGNDAVIIIPNIVADAFDYSYSVGVGVGGCLAVRAADDVELAPATTA